MPTYAGQIPIEVMFQLMSMEVPEGYKLNFAYVKRVPVDQARNSIAQGMLNQSYDYLFFVDDDTIPPKDCLMKMLALNKPIVCPPVPARREGGEDRLCLFDTSLKTQLNAILEDQKIGAGGMSCTLIKREALEAVAKKFGKPFVTNAMVDGQMFSEDVNFCRLAGELGYETWGISSVRPQHIGQNVVYQYEDHGIETYIIPS